MKFPRGMNSTKVERCGIAVMAEIQTLRPVTAWRLEYQEVASLYDDGDSVKRFRIGGIYQRGDWDLHTYHAYSHTSLGLQFLTSPCIA